MQHKFHIVLEQDEEWFIGYCPEVPGANGQGKTEIKCRRNVQDAIDLILQHRLEESLKGLPEDARVEVLDH
ncbi:MAG: type II toxin-antitoxin system HicB family antitoxin [Calditrichaeota bacterium]|nr:type II toxin-antitoxin system HicB family antitoxin [Calditrichota bacterium]MBT7616243.1 type II toxin-antitoxin system HicB family antitoxin [Calditrichota bacterium]MBT7789375.1 type II toxin-antitoxin system HicB family antitoxin [Calditrichota bacterium]